jgi:hypothetical protein
LLELTENQKMYILMQSVVVLAVAEQEWIELFRSKGHFQVYSVSLMEKSMRTFRICCWNDGIGTPQCPCSVT